MENTLPNVKKDAGYYMRVFRAEHGLTQEAAGEHVGVSGGHWSYIENGEKKPSAALGKRLADLTGGPLGVLLGLEEPK